MAIIDDKFTVSSDVDLDAHTPTDAGTGWTEIENTGDAGRIARVLAAEDFLGINIGENLDRKLYTAQGTYPGAEYDIEIDILADAQTNDPFWLLGRVTDADNYYCAGIYDSTDIDVRLLKKVATTVTEIDSADTDFNSGTWASTTIKLEIRDAAKKLFANDGGGYTELLSSADNALTSTGEAGVAWGNIRTFGEDVHHDWHVDNFLVTDQSAGGPTAVSIIATATGTVAISPITTFKGINTTALGVVALNLIAFISLAIMETAVGPPAD